MVSIDTGAVQWRDAATGREGSHLLVVMHGFGSNELDLFSLAPALPDHLTIASLRAPFVLQDGFAGMPGAYAWFDLGQDNYDRSKIDASVAAVIEWLDALEGFASVGLMGFSQGGVMSLQLARTQPERFGYLVQLSGFTHPAAHAGDDALASMEPRIPAFQAWGDRDGIIPPRATDLTREWMTAHLDLEAHGYDMEHAVIPEELSDLVAFLDRVAGRP